MSKSLLLFILLWDALPAMAWEAARPDYAWSFPADHWAHPAYRNEWWYLTGQLCAEDDPARWFGFQFTFFRVGVVPETPPWESAWNSGTAIMGHASISDLSARRHVFSELIYRAVPLLGGFGSAPEPVLAWSRAPAGGDGVWTLRWNGEAFDVSMRDDTQGVAYQLVTRPLKPLIFQGLNGYSRKGREDGAASLYYSFTRLEATGTITLDGRGYRVRGRCWMDKEFGSNQLGSDQVGWDWFSLQLDDGRELMLYLLRDAAGRVDFAKGTLVEADGTARYLDAENFAVTADATWHSPKTNATYPSRWKVSVPSHRIDLMVRPLMPEQENVSTLLDKLFYYEGAVEARDDAGAQVGRGYVELTGYGKQGRLPL